jgi:acylphosphatase
MTDDRYTVRVSITGRVQGVFFRGWTEEQAKALKLDGWVKNEPDGSVSALVSGPRADVEALIEKLHTGPRAARVAKVDVREDSAADVPAGFSVAR